MKKIRIGITGGAGYTGGELIRILLNHPNVELVFVQSKSHAGQLLSAVHQDLEGETEIQFSENLSPDIDLMYLCVGHGEARKFLQENPPLPDIRIIDLSQDFRIESNNRISSSGKPFVYGLPELNREALRTAQYVANPGCFATTIELGLLPLAKQGWLNEVYTTGITGSTGAGQGLNATSHFSWR
ncbi:MAG TPA: N-acetyl-gamma-glutamyl-phosphate reductase, partial [Puia sp.]|nr:N-acetyl-gamma-glutamyl-phosphate reductase [Puia sp.]